MKDLSVETSGKLKSSSHESKQIRRQNGRERKLNSIMAMKGRKGNQKEPSSVRLTSSG